MSLINLIVGKNVQLVHIVEATRFIFSPLCVAGQSHRNQSQDIPDHGRGHLRLGRTTGQGQGHGNEAVGGQGHGRRHGNETDHDGEVAFGGTATGERDCFNLVNQITSFSWVFQIFHLKAFTFFTQLYESNDIPTLYART